MKIPLMRQELEFVSGCVETKSTIPILKHVLIEVKKRTCTLTGTDLENAAVSAFPMASEAAFKGTVSAKQLLKVLGTLKGQDEADAAWDAKKHCLKLTAGSFEASLEGMSPETYPELPKSPADLMTLPLDDVQSLFGATRHAISAEKSRFTLNAALLDMGAGFLRSIATDGHRLSVATAPCDSKDTLRLLIGSHLASQLGKLSGTLQVGRDESHDFFFGKNQKSVRLLLQRRMTGNFPEYERVMPVAFKVKAIAKREDLLRAAKRVLPYVDERGRCARITICSTLAKSCIQIANQGGGHGECSDSVAASIPEFVSLAVGLNLGYFIEALTALTCENVEVLANNAESAVEIRGNVGEGREVREIVMPWRLN